MLSILDCIMNWNVFGVRLEILLVHTHELAHPYLEEVASALAVVDVHVSPLHIRAQNG